MKRLDHLQAHWNVSTGRLATSRPPDDGTIETPHLFLRGRQIVEPSLLGQGELLLVTGGGLLVFISERLQTFLDETPESGKPVHCCGRERKASRLTLTRHLQLICEVGDSATHKLRE